MPSAPEVSLTDARRLAIAGQGLAKPRPKGPIGKRHLSVEYTFKGESPQAAAGDGRRVDDRHRVDVPGARLGLAVAPQPHELRNTRCADYRVIVTCADALLVASAAAVAVTLTVAGDGTLFGAE